jgi:hypothetical protein
LIFFILILIRRKNVVFITKKMKLAKKASKRFSIAGKKRGCEDKSEAGELFPFRGDA